MKSTGTFIAIYDVIRPILDIGVLTFLLYKVYTLIVKTNGLQLIKSAVLIVVAYLIALLLDLKTITWIFNMLAPVFLLAFAIVFQKEFKQIFLKLGQSQLFDFGSKSKHTYVDSVLIAAEILSKQKRGMLVVFMRHMPLDDAMVKAGTKLNADISSNLLLTIFGTDTQLHDGACIIQDGKLIAAGCFFQISEQYDIKKTFGTRHRAAIGVTEISDSVVLIVSEETGAISLAYDSKLHYDLSINDLTKTLENLLEITPEAYNLEDTIDEQKRDTRKNNE